MSVLDKLRPPEGQPPLLDVQDLLRLIFDGMNPPHQAIATGMSKLIGFKPSELVVLKSGEAAPEKPPEASLSWLMHEFVARYSGPYCSAQNIRRLCTPTIEALPRLLDDVLQETATRTAYTRLLGKVCGETTLADYKTGDSLEDNISKWVNDVKRRVLARFAADREWTLRCLEVRLVFDGSHAPHRALTAGLVKLIGLAPGRVQTELGGTPLRELMVVFGERFLETHPISEFSKTEAREFIRKNCEPTLRSLALPVGEVLRVTDRPERLSENQLCGSTCLSDYAAPRHLERDIDSWAEDVYAQTARRAQSLGGSV